MKTILFIRHAKSSWDHVGISDYARPLNKRGETDALAMAEKLYQQKILIDTFVTSTAQRAQSTCKIFAEVYNAPENQIIYKNDLYHALPDDFYKVIEGLDDAITNVALFAHNPGIMEMVSTQLKINKIIEMPTCAIVAFKTDCTSWKNYAASERELLFYKYPKEE